MNSLLLPDLPCFDVARDHPADRHCGGRARHDRRGADDGVGGDVFHRSAKRGTRGWVLGTGETLTGLVPRVKHGGVASVRLPTTG